MNDCFMKKKDIKIFKKKLLIKYIIALCIFFLACGVLFAQVGVGTPLPDASAQLDVVANNKGVLIPRIALTGSTDESTITNGNILSLLVFNTATVNDIIPGYYYWDGEKWQRLININDAILEANGVLTGIGQPTEASPANPSAGNVYVDEITGIIYTFNGTTWVNIVNVDNGLGKTQNNVIELGGALTKATAITTSATKTLAIKGLENVNANEENEVVMIEKNTGVLKKVAASSLFQEEVVLIIANTGQTQFTTPLMITDVKKVNVYRNGVRIDFTAIDNSTIELETEIFCYQNDEIRIVQFY